MNTQKMNGAVDRAVDGTVVGVTSRAAYWAVTWVTNEDVFRAANDAVYWAVREAVRETVRGALFWAVDEDSPHPGLQDFLRTTGIRES